MTKPNPPVGRVGGKNLLANTILEMFPPHELYCEVCCGAAWLLFKKKKAKVEVINDKDNELINFFQVVKTCPENLVSQLSYELYSRDRFKYLKRQISDALTNVERAARFFYIMKSSFAGIGEYFGRSCTQPAKVDFSKVKEVIDKAYERLSRVTVECLDYKEIIKLYDREYTLFYIDPPYRKSRGSAAYKHKFKDCDYVQLREVLKSIQGKFILSLNDDSFIRETFKDFHIQPVSTLYSLNHEKTIKGFELIIKNF